MLFTAPFFLFCFLPAFLGAYYLLGRSVRTRNLVALIGSIVFFAWGEPIFVLVLIALTFLDYRVSLYVAPGRHRRLRKPVLVAAIVLSVGILLASKYLTFFASQWYALLGMSADQIASRIPHIPLVLGISFITFHRISFLVDSYKGRAVPPRNLFDCALYIFLFPQLVAGPIIRYHDIGSQIHRREHTAPGFMSGFLRFATGLVKKLLLADPLGITADRVFGMPAGELSPLFAWGGILAYTFQIYFDFSGYSDMAIGLGKMLGFRFPENFNRPYTAASVTDFWRRWHISLSNWMRIYLYIPLGGNRGPAWRTYLNLWTVFLLSGIWHGANWSFVVWGAYYGLFLCIERAYTGLGLPALPLTRAGRQALTFLIVIVGWVFFRANDLTHAWHYLGAMAGLSEPTTTLPPWGLVFGNRTLFTLALAGVLALAMAPARLNEPPAFLAASWNEAMAWQPGAHATRQLCLLALLTLVLVVFAAAAIVSSDYVPFLYFRF